MNSRGNRIWLGGNVDRDLLLLSTKGIWVWLSRKRDPQGIVFQQESLWERASRMIQNIRVNLLEVEEAVYIVGGRN
jgi:hypothetical protein